MVVRVGLVVGDRVESVFECFGASRSRKHPQEHSVLARIVPPLGERQAVLLRVGQAHAEASWASYPAVARAVHRAVRARCGNRPLGRSPGLTKARPRRGRSGRGGDRLLHPVELLAVGLRRPAADRVADPGGRHQIAFVGGVDEHPSPVGLVVERRDRRMRPSFSPRHLVRSRQASRTTGTLASAIIESKTFFSAAWGSNIHIALLAVDGRSSGPCCHILPLLLQPGSVVLVVPPDGGRTREPARSPPAPGVGPTEASACQAAQMPFRDKDHGPAGPRRLDRAVTPAEVPP